jgi:DNA primase
MQKNESPTGSRDTVRGRIAPGAWRRQPGPKLPKAHRIDFNALKRAASFERVLQYYGIELGCGRGAQRKALCPFHCDTRPSLNVNLDRKVFNCFPCGDGGDIVKFVAKKEYPADYEGHLLEAARKLAEICGIRIDNDVREAIANSGRTEVASVRSAPATQAVAPASENVSSIAPNHALSFRLRVDPTHPYLAERGLSPQTVEIFGLGYCVSEKSIMRQRILIPIHNERGELVAYAGRWPGDSGWPEGTDKYLLPPKFQKMRVLYNLNRVIKGMVVDQWPGHERHVVIVEGFFGAFAVHPLAPCVALMGSAISDHHLRLLREANVKFVTLLLDGPGKPETAQQSAARNHKSAAAVYQLSASGFFVIAPVLGVGEQPDSIDRGRLAQLVAT